MNSVNKTLYIPLYGKSYVSKKGLFLCDIKAEQIWSESGFELKGKSKSKWLAYYMGIRSAVFDDYLKEQLTLNKDAIVIHIGCGLDSRVLRVNDSSRMWYDVDFEDVIEERKKYYSQKSSYKMVGADIRTPDWLEAIEKNKNAIIVMEGVSMYLKNDELRTLMKLLASHFDKISFLMDSYTSLSAKLSKYKNPINDVGVTEVYGIDNPKTVETQELLFAKEHIMTPERYIAQLHGIEKIIFKKMYAGSISKKLYKLYEYKKA